MRAFHRKLLGWLVLFPLATGCAKFPGQPDPADRPELPGDVVTFAPLYKKHCSGCHGADGKFGAGPPLNDPLFRALILESELNKVITDGRRGTPMSAFAKDKGGTLSPKQIAVLVAGIKSWGTTAKVENLPPYLASDEGQGNPASGKVVFAKACAGCHGKDGKNDGMGSLLDPSYLASTSDQLLRRLIVTGRSDLGMPDYSGKLGREPNFQPLNLAEIRDVTAWLISHRHSTTPK
jgi:mono/diheme cytochrome c family protein